MNGYYLGVDVGSVSTNIVLMDDNKKVIQKFYLLTQGRPIKVLREGLNKLKDSLPRNTIIRAAGATGSGRQLAGAILNADVVKNEIIAHGIAALGFVKDVKTIIEIGGQDSKIIIIRDGIIMDFAMNSVCAAGTGSFIDRQAARLGIPIEIFGDYALKAEAPVRIAGRCAVFAESDMIHKQQLGHSEEDIVGGLCEALVRNYLNNVGKGKQILPKVIFQGGVAANIGIRKAFENELQTEVFVPENFEVMGAIGVALLAKEEYMKKGSSQFKGLDAVNREYQVKSFQCSGCPNICEIIQIIEGNKTFAQWGDRCGKCSTKIDVVEKGDECAS